MSSGKASSPARRNAFDFASNQGRGLARFWTVVVARLLVALPMDRSQYVAYLAMGRGERADRICRRSIPRKEESLAATTAEIDVTPVARLARLLHPGFPAEAAECGGT